MGLAPVPHDPERTPATYEVKQSPATPGNRGPLRFEEGIGTDTDVPNDFVRGMTEGGTGAPGRSNRPNPESQFKHANETMSERAHLGSAAWVEAPEYLGSFAGEAMGDHGAPSYPSVQRSGRRYERTNPARVLD